MGNPYDPKVPLYEGQALQQQVQQPQVQPAQAAGLHFLAGIGDLVVAGAHFFAGGGDDEEGEAEEAPRRRFRPRVFGANPATKRVGKGSCCRRPVGR